MIKKIFSILIILSLFFANTQEVFAATKTPVKDTSKTAVKKTTTKKVASKKSKGKKVSYKKKKYIIANPPLITLETAPHSAKPIAKATKKSKKKRT